MPTGRPNTHKIIVPWALAVQALPLGSSAISGCTGTQASRICQRPIRTHAIMQEHPHCYDGQQTRRVSAGDYPVAFPQGPYTTIPFFSKYIFSVRQDRADRMQRACSASKMARGASTFLPRYSGPEAGSGETYFLVQSRLRPSTQTACWLASCEYRG